MEFDGNAFRELVEEKGTEVYSASYDGGAPGYSGVAGVSKFAGRFWSYDDNGGFGGPYESLREALSEVHLCFGEVEVSVHVSGLTAAAVAELLRLEAPEGHVVEINGEEWILGEDAQLFPRNPRPKKQSKRRSKKT